MVTPCVSSFRERRSRCGRQSPDSSERLLQNVPLARYQTKAPAAAYMRTPSKMNHDGDDENRGYDGDHLLDPRLAIALIGDELSDVGSALGTAARWLADQPLAATRAGWVVVDRHLGFPGVESTGSGHAR